MSWFTNAGIIINHLIHTGTEVQKRSPTFFQICYIKSETNTVKIFLASGNILLGKIFVIKFSKIQTFLTFVSQCARTGYSNLNQCSVELYKNQEKIIQYQHQMLQICRNIQDMNPFTFQCKDCRVQLQKIYLFPIKLISICRNSHICITKSGSELSVLYCIVIYNMQPTFICEAGKGKAIKMESHIIL